MPPGPTTARRRARLGIAVACALVVLGVTVVQALPEQASGSEAAWHVDEAPFRLHLRAGAHTVSEAPGSSPAVGTRLSYRLVDGTVHAATTLRSRRSIARGTRYLVGTDEPGRTIRVDVQTTATGTQVTWQPQPATNVEMLTESLAASAREHFVGSGERGDRVDLARSLEPLKVWNACRSNKPAPFLVSSAGWGLLLRTDAVGRLSFPMAVDGADFRCELGTSPCPLASGVAAVQVCVKAPRMRYVVLSGTPRQILEKRAGTVGTPLMPPRSLFALIQWRDVVAGAGQLLDDARRVRELGIPLGWVILDNPWERGGCVGALAFDPERFPDPAGTIRSLRSEGVRLMLWVSPYVRAGCAAAGDAVVPGVEDGLDAIDLSAAATREALSARLAALLRLGVAGFKADRGDEIDFEYRGLAGGSGTALHNRFALFFARAVAGARDGGPPLPALFRAASPGSERVVTGFWGGDQPSTFDGLRQAVRRGLTAGLAGYSTWGSDIGGYGGEEVTAELVVRWAQFGALSPVMEIGGKGANAHFWDLGPAAISGVRDAVRLHYELHPLQWELAREAAATGVPIMRPLAVEFPGDEAAWTVDDEVMLGSSLLAAPVVEPGTSREVYLPAGTWIDLGTGASRTGPVRFVRRTPLAELPLYLRTGSAVPVALRLPIWSAPWKADDLVRSDRVAWVVASPRDGGVVRASTAADGTVRMRRSGRRIEISVETAKREAQVVLVGVAGAERVAVDGTAIPRAADEAALRSMRSGWLLRTGTTPGIVLKLPGRSARAGAVIELSARS